MNNEIKEILSYLKKKENTRRLKCITIEESKHLLDYITKLENIIKEASEYIKNNELYEVLYDDNGDYFNTIDSQASDDLLNILQSRSDANER